MNAQMQIAYGDWTAPGASAPYGDWWDDALSSIKGVAASVVPDNTLVGKWARGDTKGAIKDAIVTGAKGIGESISPTKQPASKSSSWLPSIPGGSSLPGGSVNIGGAEIPVLVLIGGAAIIGLIAYKML